MRLKRSDPAQPGYTRRRYGKGFVYYNRRGRTLTDERIIKRIEALVIPPAWRDVWICPDPAGHIQAVGTDAAGRRQYLYHRVWRDRRDRRKFARVATVADRLAAVRRKVTQDLSDKRLTRKRVLALAVRLIDQGLFRVGSDQYAAGDEPTYGIATLECRHVSAGRDTMRFRFCGKGGIEHDISIRDPKAAVTVRALLRVRGPAERLLAYRSTSGMRPLHASDINTYLAKAAGAPITAKDLRTWHATVRAATALSKAGRPSSATHRRRVISQVVKSVAEDLGNTPTIARASYVDPRVIEAYEQGITVDVPPAAPTTGPAAERAVRTLLTQA
ncbi:DNA topoisomerase IB [Luedemannella helvata]|uniref:DNA topoisomerase n=1 Tax=Luedemannella helvata TaxID=349315 RepID=A0ABN2KIR6_9ACTN